MAELGKEAYQKYPFLYIFGNNPGANNDNMKNGDSADSRTSTISEVANSTGMDFTIFIKLYFCSCSQSLNNCHQVSIHI